MKGLFEHEGFRVFGSFTNSYLGSSISYSGSGTIQPVEGAFAAYILGRTQSVNNGLIKLWPGYSTEAAANDITRILIQ